MYLSGVKAEIFGKIRETPTVVTVGDKKVANVIITYSDGYGEKSKLKNAECSFWQADAESITKYPAGHEIIVSGILSADGYINENNVPSVKIKINVRDWRSCQKLVKNETKTQAAQSTQQSAQQSASMLGKKSQPHPDQNEYLKKALEVKLTFGPYIGDKLGEVANKDIKYVYNMCYQLNGEWKKVFLTVYKHVYNLWKKQQVAVKGNTENCTINTPIVTSDDDLPF